VLAFDLSTGGIPKLNADWRWENQEEAVLSACSSLVSVIIDSEDGSQVVQFSHFSVKEFLTSDRLARCMEESQFYIHVEHSHTILAQACLGVLLSLDDRTDEDSAWKLPLYQYATGYWVEHAQVGKVELVIRDTLDSFFDTERPHFSAWVRSNYSLQWELSKGFAGENDTDVPSSAAPLYFAASRGFYGLVERLLIKHPQQVHHLGGQRGTPLHASVHRGHIEVAQLMVAHGADINSHSALNWTPLHIASEMGHLNIVQWLLNHGADVNSKEASGCIPLHCSARNGHLEVCRTLLEHGAGVNTRGDTGSTPFLEALKSGHTDTMWLMLNCNPDVNVHDSKDHWYGTPLHHAAGGGYLKLVQKLLELNAEVNRRNGHNSTPLLIASQFGYTDVVRVLLDHSADVYAYDNDGDTSLHVSAGYGHLEITQILLERRAEVNFQNNNGSTPLLRASGDQHRRYLNSDIVQLLLAHGADVHVRNHSGQTALETASELAFGLEQHEIVRLLSQRTAERTSGTGNNIQVRG
jgi:ankyrin repeat protein